MCDEERLEHWIACYGDMLLRVCYLQLGDRTLAEDALQETFLRAWRHMGQFQRRHGAAERTWLTRIALNTCATVRRSAWFRHVNRHVTPESLPLAAPPEDTALLADLARLPDQLRRVIVLRYYQRLTLEETAQALGIGRSTAWERERKALRLLRCDDEGRNAP